ncbi:hypothetical protein [Actinophytocola oryzae]|uniref:Uncharacterized protein n=1 Tax=Actinophytocola oryzae TaxID=502181 RepID=A0A4R7W184_9PSEU|nr:hypothetical protein [Actinophytocola oryzae]TDV56303.1 hypothetical protein CLV71_102369 [Actinophytocola oryzae]
MELVDGALNLVDLLVGSGENAYRSGRAEFTDVTISAGSAAAGTFTITGLHLDYHLGAEGCQATEGAGG